MKKRVAIVTVFDNFNNGTYLQAFATACLVEELGYEVLFVNYCREFNSYKTYYKRLCEKERNPLKVLIRLYRYVRRRKRMQRIVTSHFKTTSIYVGYKMLEMNPPEADIYLTGSDQVWNTLHNHGVDKAFYWGEIKDRDKRFVSYASSIGMIDFAVEDKPIIKKMLDRYSVISVREQSAVDLLMSMGIKSTMVLDPTLLLNKERWLGYVHDGAENSNSIPYILVYSVERFEQDYLIDAVAQKLSSYLNIPVWQMCLGKATYKPYIKNYIEDPQPNEFLQLILNASFVVACSFHGTAFSINFNKPFVSIVPEKYSSRVKSLLADLHLYQHFISDLNDFNCENICKIDYNNVNRVLNEKRKKSFEFLETALRGY